MSHETSRSERIEALFNMALERTPEERDAFLIDACAGDEALRADVDVLLAGAAEAFEFFDDLGGKIAESMPDELRDASEHRRSPDPAPPSAARSPGIGFWITLVGVALVTGLVAGALTLRSRVDGNREPGSPIRLVEMLRPVDPKATRGGALEARELLDSAAIHIESHLAERPAERATLHDELGRAYAHLGLEGRARESFETAVRLLRDHGGASEALADALLHLGTLLREVGDTAGAEAHLREALRHDLKHRAWDGARIARDRLELARCLRLRGKLEEAASELQQALIAGKSSDVDSSTAEISTELGRVASARGDGAAAQDHLEAAERILRDGKGDDGSALASVLTHRAEAWIFAGEPERAVPLYEEALDLRRRARPTVDSATAETLLALGRLFSDAGDPDAARPLLREALALQRGLLPADAPELARLQALLAALD